MIPEEIAVKKKKSSSDIHSSHEKAHHVDRAGSDRDRLGGFVNFYAVQCFH